ncbi:hypothetical protein [Actinomyces sp. 2119]|nr:hypothetical protein [Actinomyces sp. 2119]
MSWEPQEGQARMDVDVTVRGRGSGQGGAHTGRDLTSTSPSGGEAPG